jgi:3-keto-L-gulonate-6-phosphate decarboxylase
VSVAVKEIPETVMELEFAGGVKAVTVGAIVSARVMVVVVGAIRLAETLPAASLAQA